MTASRIHTVIILLLAVVAAPAWSQSQRCPSAQYLPQLTIDEIRDPAIPVIDDWQVFWRGVPLSDAQVAQLSQRDPMIEKTRGEMEKRGTWVYVGMLTTAVGTIVSSVGWYLYGRRAGGDKDTISSGASLAMGLSGFAVGVGGILIVTDSIQTPLEPLLAPTPQHRLTRDEARHLVAAINSRLYDEICEAAGEILPVTSAAPAPDETAAEQEQPEPSDP